MLTLQSVNFAQLKNIRKQKYELKTLLLKSKRVSDDKSWEKGNLSPVGSRHRCIYIYTAVIWGIFIIYRMSSCVCVCVCVGSIKYCLTPQRLNIIKRRKKNPPKLDYLFKIINWNEFDQFTIVNRSVPVSLYSYSSFDSAFSYQELH